MAVVINKHKIREKCIDILKESLENCLKYEKYMDIETHKEGFMASQQSEVINNALFDGLEKLQTESAKIASHKDGPVLTAIENVQKSLQKCLNAGQSMQGAKPLCEGLTCVLYNVCLHYKLARKVVKLLVLLEARYPGEVKIVLKERCRWAKDDSTLEHQKTLAMWSQLLETSSVSRELLTLEFSGFISLLTSQIVHIWCDGGHWSKERQEKLQLCVKVSLQLTQHLNTSVGSSVWNTSAAGPSMTRLLEVLLHTVVCEDVYEDMRRLAATVFGYIVQLAPDKQASIDSFQRLLFHYETGATICLGRVELHAPSNRFMDYGSLSLIQGFLSCCPISQFSYGPLRDADGTECPTLAMYLLHRISTLCQNNLHIYQSIKTLLLWYQKVLKCPGHPFIPHDLTVLHPVVSLTLPIIWSHLDSPVDGVSELTVAVFQSLIDSMLNKATTKGGKKGGANKSKRALEKGEFSGQFQGGYEAARADVRNDRSEDASRGETRFNAEVGRTGGDDTTDMDCSENGGGVNDAEDRSGISAISNLNIACEKREVYECQSEESGLGLRSEGGESLVLHLLDKVMQMSWQVKGKYLLCAVLLPHIQIEKFLEQHSDIWEQLLQCMSTNYMCPPATQVYKALCASILEIGHDKWKSVCLPHLITGLTSKHSLMCYNVCHLWLPWTLSTVSDSYKTLLDELKARTPTGERSEPLLRAQMSVCMATRRMQIAGLRDLPHTVVVEALLHPSDDIRLDAFAFVCNSPKTSESISVAEVDLLKCSLPYAMTSDSPPFRQQLQAHIHALVARVRDSVLADLRVLEMKGQKVDEEQRQKVKADIDIQIDLVEWLWYLCVEQLHPGSNFQRLKTSLEWMSVVLDTLVYMPTKRRKKAGCPEAAGKVLKYAVDQGKWQLFTHDVTRSLLAGVTDGTDDIRGECCNILLEYFPHPLSLTSDPRTPSNLCDLEVCGLLQSALTLCSQPRSHDADGGALMCKLLCHIYVVGGGVEFSRDKNGVMVCRHTEPSSPSAAVAALLRLLVQQLQESLQASRKNALEAARNVSAQGFIVATTYCVSDLLHTEPEDLRPVIQSLVAVTRELVDASLDILGGRLRTDGSAPSFEQMGMSIQEVIDQSQGLSQNEEEEVTLTTEHQLLMTWAWLNIRESSVLYCKLAALPVHTNLCPGILSLDQVEELGQVMIKILTRCRHRGAIEGCCEALCVYCTKMLQSPHPELQKVPGKMLADVLSMVLHANTGKMSSVTRRSAGLPLIVKAVLSVLLKQTVADILTTASNPLPTDTDARLDLPQVHALNILKVLIAEATLTGTMMPHIERACVLAVEGFSAPLWPVRNSATQLFTSLLNRMLGQKKTKEDTLHTSTTSEFFSHFPSLRGFLLSHLQAAAQQHTKGDIHPSLFPVLSILCRLSAGVDVGEIDSCLTEYLSSVLTLLGSPVYAVRERAAKAVVSLISPGTADQFLLDLALDLPVYKNQSGRSFNRNHGQLICLTAVLNSLATNRQQEGNVMSHLQQVLEERAWLGGSADPCPLVRAVYWSLMVQVNPLVSLDGVAKEILQANDDVPLVGFPQWTEVIFHHWLSEDRQSTLKEKVSLCMNSQNVDVKIVCLKLVASKAEQKEFSTDEALVFQTLLLKSMSTSFAWLLLCECLTTLVTLYDAAGGTFIADLDLRGCWEKQLLKVILEKGDSRPAALALSVYSIVINTEETSSASVSDWVYILQRGCDPSKSEEMRENTARSLHMTALKLIHSILDEDCISTMQEGMIMRILHTTVTLLVDENSEVRRLTAAFVRELPGIPQCCLYGDIHPSYALRLLFEYVLCELCQSPIAMRDVISWMQTSKNTREVLEGEVQGKEVLFESQDLNPYRENTVLMSYISTFLQSHRDNISMSCINTWRRDLLQELEWCSQCLSQHCTGVLNVSRKPRVFDSVSGLLHRVQVYLSITGKHRDFTGPVVQLAKLVHLHPSLQRLVTNIKSVMEISEDP